MWITLEKMWRTLTFFKKSFKIYMHYEVWDNHLNTIKSVIQQKLLVFFEGQKSRLKFVRKSDYSEVTSFEIDISKHIGMYFKSCGETSFTFLSEENPVPLAFPCLVLDPIDGTKEFIKRVPECALSLALLSNDSKENRAWLFNPYTYFDLRSSGIPFVQATVPSPPYLGLISRTEFEKGLFNKFSNPILNFSPRGSIAFKLGLLASGGCDFVVTFRPKNLWDIAAGTVLLKERGISFFDSKGEELTLDKEHWTGPLLWCRSEIAPILIGHLF